MNTTRLQDAEDRLRRCRETSWLDVYTERPMFGLPSQKVADLETVSNARLDEVQADDAMPITVEWMRTFCRERTDDLNPTLFTLGQLALLQLRRDGKWVAVMRAATLSASDWPYLTEIKNRGELRLLCRALKLPLGHGCFSNAAAEKEL